VTWVGGTPDDLIAALAGMVPPGRTVLSRSEFDRLREVTAALVHARGDCGRREVARFQDLRDRELQLDRAVLDRMFRGRTVMVTGGTGCIGSSLLAQLRELAPMRLVSVSRGTTAAVAPVGGVDYQRVDLREAAAVDAVFSRVRPDVVFHLGAQRSPALAEVEVARTFSTNVLGSVHVFDAASRHGAMVVHASTGKAMRPYSSDVYAASKKMTEWLLQYAVHERSLRAAAVRFTHVVDNSIVYRRLREWVNTGTTIRLHDPQTCFYLQSAREAAQLLLCAATVASGDELPLAAIRDVGMPVALLDLAIGAIADQAGNRPERVVPIYLCGPEPGYDPSVYPGLYDPLLAGDVSPLLSAFEAHDVSAAISCDGVDVTVVRAGQEHRTRALVGRLGSAALAGADPARLRAQAEECGWAVLASIASMLPTRTLRRQRRLLDQVPPTNVSSRDRRTLDVLARELWRRDADPIRVLGDQAPAVTPRPPARAF
jgi:nucleoside-diphosphate-sugar epimerase